MTSEPWWAPSGNTEVRKWGVETDATDDADGRGWKIGLHAGPAMSGNLWRARLRAGRHQGRRGGRPSKNRIPAANGPDSRSHNTCPGHSGVVMAARPAMLGLSFMLASLESWLA